MLRSVHKEFLWSGEAMGHKGWARIPDNTHSVLASGDLCQSTQRMGCHGAQVSKPLALKAYKEAGAGGPFTGRLVTPVPMKLPGARPQAVRLHYLHLCSGTIVTPGTHLHPQAMVQADAQSTSPACSSDFPGRLPWDSVA